MRTVFQGCVAVARASAVATSPSAEKPDGLRGVAKLDESDFRLELGAGVELETLDASAGVG